MDPGLDLPAVKLGRGQQLHPVAELPAELDVQRRDVRDPRGEDLLELHGGAEGQPGEDREFVGGVDALHVVGGVGFGIPLLLRLGQDRLEIATLVGHPGKDVVGGAVQDPVEGTDVVGHEALPGSSG